MSDETLRIVGLSKEYTRGKPVNELEQAHELLTFALPGTVAAGAFALALFLGCAAMASAEEKIQLAILLDTSNSMDGLIGQAKAQARAARTAIAAHRNERP